MSKNELSNSEKLAQLMQVAGNIASLTEDQIANHIDAVESSYRKPSKRCHYQFNDNFEHIYELYCRFPWLIERKLVWHHYLKIGKWGMQLYVKVNKKELVLLELARRHD